MAPKKSATKREGEPLNALLAALTANPSDLPGAAGGTRYRKKTKTNPEESPNENGSDSAAAAEAAVDDDVQVIAETQGIASEVLQVFGLVRHFAEEVVAQLTANAHPALLLSLQSFRYMSDIVTLLQEIKFKPSGFVPDQINKLRTLQENHMQAFLACYGESAVKPKHHFSRHIPDHLAAHGFLYDAWTVERKHRVAKRISNTIENTTQFERTLLDRMWNVHLLAARDRHASATRLTTPVPAVAELGFEMFSASMQLPRGSIISASDIVLRGGACLQILGCVQQSSNFWLLARPFIARGVRGYGKLWLPSTSSLELVPAGDDFTCVQHWTFLASENNMLLTLDG